MSTIDDQRLVREVTAARPTVRQVHQAVRVARVRHCRHGRARAARRGRVRRPPVSQYRPAAVVDTTTQPRVVRNDIPGKRRPVPAVVAAAVALSLLYVGFIRVFEPDMNYRILVIGVYVIAAAAAVCLNAFTLGTVTEPAGIRSEPSWECSTRECPRVTSVNLDRTISRSDDE